jgi:FKBP-type peptidyl-prolyl cis-trans isomerase (trigger factor)
MIQSYGVERFDEVTAKQLKEVGFTSELMEHLASQGVTKDQVTEAMERAADENVKLDALIGGIVQVKPEVQAEEASLPPAEAAAE